VCVCVCVCVCVLQVLNDYKVEAMDCLSFL